MLRGGREYLAQIPDVVGCVFRNPDLRRVEIAYVGFNGAEWGVWIAVLVYAYERGGATTAGLVSVAQLVPAGLVAPVAAVLADRRRPARVLAFAYAAQATAMGATAVALLSHGPPLLVYAFAAVAATAVTLTRPTQSTLMPALARTPDELTAANVVSGWVESLSVLAAPAAAGLLIGVGGPGTAVAAMAALVAVGALVVLPVEGPAPAAASEAPGRLTELAAGFRVLSEAPEPRLLVGLVSAQYVAVGALDVLFVVLALGVLDLGGSGAGYLNAAFGAGGVLGIAATVALVGRAHLLRPLLLGVGVWSAAFVALGLHATVVGAFLLLAASGAARSLFDVAGRTLLQRSAPVDVLSRVFGIVEGLTMAALAIGAILAPALVALGGAGAAFVGTALVLPAVALAAGRRLQAVDRGATIPVVEIALLRMLPVFAPLGVPEVETIARSLEPRTVAAGTEVIRQGEPGEEFYVVAEGTLDVLVDGRPTREVCRGDGVGEIALLMRVPRTATVVARTDARLYALAKAPFLAALSGNSASAFEADRLVRERLPAAAATAADGTIAP